MRGPVRRDDLAGRIEASLGYRGPQDYYGSQDYRGPQDYHGPQGRGD
jgi:hypothetical protein